MVRTFLLCYTYLVSYMTNYWQYTNTSHYHFQFRPWYTDVTTIADLINKRAGTTHEYHKDDMDTLAIDTEAEMIAVINSDRFQILTQGDLAACNKCNKIYLCENHQVLHTDVTNSCLGSIYSN